MTGLEPFDRRARRGVRCAALALFLLAPLPLGAQSVPDFDRMSGMLSLMQSFYTLMDQVHGMVESPQKAALLQMHEIEEIYKKSGEHARVIPVYRGVLERTDDPVIRALAYMKLADVLKKTGKSEESIEVLREALNESLARAAKPE